MRVDHDISMLIPEVFSRMSDEERSAKNLIAEGALEPVPNIVVDGQEVEASRLGYRMTKRFATKYFGRIFLHPDLVFTPEMLSPELQGEDVYAESVATIVETHRRVAQSYIDDGTIALGVPPIRALLEVMANGQTSDGLTLQDDEFRKQFDRESVLASDWYRERLQSEKDQHVALLKRSADAVEDFVSRPHGATEERREVYVERLERLREELSDLEAQPLEDFAGTLGRQVRWNAV